MLISTKLKIVHFEIKYVNVSKGQIFFKDKNFKEKFHVNNLMTFLHLIKYNLTQQDFHFAYQ